MDSERAATRKRSFVLSLRERDRHKLYNVTWWDGWGLGAGAGDWWLGAAGGWGPGAGGRGWEPRLGAGSPPGRELRAGDWGLTTRGCGRGRGLGWGLAGTGARRAWRGLGLGAGGWGACTGAGRVAGGVGAVYGGREGGAGGWGLGHAATHANASRTLANACGRLRTLRERFANALATIPGQRLDPWTPTFKTRTLLLRIRENLDPSPQATAPSPQPVSPNPQAGPIQDVVPKRETC